MDDDEAGLVAEAAAALELPVPPVRRTSWPQADGELSGLRWGDGPPAVVMLHGGGLSAHSWDGVLLRLATPAVAFDLPGHGRSSWWPEPLYLPEAMADAIIPALRAVAPGGTALVGHSLGGLVALALAARVPEMVSRLVLVDTSPSSTPERNRQAASFEAADGFPSLEVAVDHVRGGRSGRASDALRRALRHNLHKGADGRWWWRHDTRAHPTIDRWDALFAVVPQGWDHAAAVRCPTLVIRGSRSPITTKADLIRFASTVQDVRVQTVADAGHNVHSDQPASLAAVVLSFMHAGGTGAGWPAADAP